MTRLRALLTGLLAYWVRPEPYTRPAREIALDARRAERRAEDVARAAKRLYPTKEKP